MCQKSKFDECPVVYLEQQPTELLVSVPTLLSTYKFAEVELTHRDNEGNVVWVAKSHVRNYINSHLTMPVFVHNRSDIPAITSATIKLTNTEPTEIKLEVTYDER